MFFFFFSNAFIRQQTRRVIIIVTHIDVCDQDPFSLLSCSGSYRVTWLDKTLRDSYALKFITRSSAACDGLGALLREASKSSALIGIDGGARTTDFCGDNQTITRSTATIFEQSWKTVFSNRLQ